AMSVIFVGCQNSTSDGDSAGSAGRATMATGGVASGVAGRGGTAGASGSATAGKAGVAEPGGAATGGAAGSTTGSTAGAGGASGSPSEPQAGGGGSTAHGGGAGGISAGGRGVGGRGAGGAAAGGPGRGGAAGKAAGAGGAGGTITVWLAGDSTVANGETPCPVGWGKVFGALFDERVQVTNSAVGGRSVRTWLYNVGTTMDATGECELELDKNGDPTVQARWTAMLDGMKPGDYLFIQFGINDGDPSCDRHVGLDAFKQSYGVMAQAAKARGAQPIFVTPTSSISCSGSSARGTRGDYVPATIEAGMDDDVPVIDLHARSVALYTSLGFCPLAGGDVSASTTGPVGDFFCDDHTHFDTPGATQIAGLVATALTEQGIGLASYLK
ncbi:MAG TPA: hypothetical protein VGQ57_04035, partial [Polyangiaceae bacterium]|nr:hypothetical protein [Polyangiaceae bacterium]